MTQLFDLKRDPWEITNLAEEPAYTAVKTRLTARLQRFQRELGDELNG